MKSIDLLDFMLIAKGNVELLGSIK